MLASSAGYLARAARPRQWTKNLLLFAAILFAHKLSDPNLLANVSIGFVAFCLLSSGVYLINDIVDKEQDKHHPTKSLRPIAAGHLSSGRAGVWAFVFIGVSMAAAFSLNCRFGFLCIGYFLLQVTYMFWLKHVVILDVLVIAIGFVLRAIGGALIISVYFSHWLMLCTLFLALSLIVCKRRHELISLGDSSSQHRKTLEHYSPAMLDQMVAVVTCSTVLSYALYTVSPETIARFGGDQLVYTVPFVLFGIFRYLYLVYRKEEGGSPEGLLLGDKPLLINIALYGATVVALVYGHARLPF